MEKNTVIKKGRKERRGQRAMQCTGSIMKSALHWLAHLMDQVRIDYPGFYLSTSH